ESGAEPAIPFKSTAGPLGTRRGSWSSCSLPVLRRRGLHHRDGYPNRWWLDGALVHMIWLLIIVLSYLIGSIPSGYLVARSKGIDIRQRGSSNIGAANVARIMGKAWGYLVGVCDFLKGFLAVKLGLLIAAHFLPSLVAGGVIAAIACILG